MSPGQVIINEMNLNVPGFNQIEADLLGQDVVKRINEMLGKKEIPQHTINNMELQIEIPQGTPKEHLAGIIANQICKSLI